MSFIDRRRRVSPCTFRRADRIGRQNVMAIALICTFCAVPFQAAAVMCSWTESHDWVDCCSSEAAIENRSLMSQKKVAHGFTEGKLALKLRVSYSAGKAPWSDHACAKLNVTVRLGNGRKVYSHIVAYASGVPDYIEDTAEILFAPPLRQGDVYVESVSCKMPKALLDGYPCGSDRAKELEERERRMLEEERERLALQQIRQELKQEEESKKLNQHLLEQKKREHERRRIDRQREQQERQRLAQRKIELQRQQLSQRQGEADGLQQFMTGFRTGMDIVRGLDNLFGGGADSKGFSGYGAGSDSITGACQQAQMRIARRLESQSVSGEGMCGTYRSYAQMMEGVARELRSAGCPESGVREYEQAAAEARRGAKSVCEY